MQSCWEVDPAARPDMPKIQLAMRGILPPVKLRPAVITRHPSTSPVRVSSTIDGGSALETNGSSSEGSSLSMPIPLIPPPPSGDQLTLEPIRSPSPTIPSPRPSPPPELEGTWTPLDESSFFQSSVSPRLPPLLEDDYEPEPHSAGISIPPSVPPMVPPQSPRSSLQPSTASILSSRPTLASDYLGRMSPTSSESDISTIPELDDTESVPPKRKLSWQFSKITQSPSNSTLVRPNPAEMLRVVPSRSSSQSSTILPIISTIRRRIPASEDVLHSLKNASSDPEALLRLARDRSVSAGNLEGLLNLAIVGSLDPSRDKRFEAAFLTIYQLFATSEQVFEILKRHFMTTSIVPSMAASRFS